MSWYVCMLLVLVILGMSNAEITDDMPNANTNWVTQKAGTEEFIASNDDMTRTALKQNTKDAGCITHPRTICLNEAHCSEICIGIPNEKCQKMNVKSVKNLLVLTKNKTGKLKPNSVVDDGFVCTLDGKVPAEEWQMITIQNDNGTGETREYYSDASCKNKCKFDCVECKSTDQIKSSLKKQNLQGLQLYECTSTPWWVWALVVAGILVLLGIFICVLWCCCCGCSCCGCGGSKAKAEAANTAQLELGTNVQAPSRANTDTVVKIVTTPPITPPRSPPHEHSRRSGRSGRSSRSSHGSHRSNRTERSHGSVSTQQSRHQSSRRPSNRLEPYDRTSSSLSGSGTPSHSH